MCIGAQKAGTTWLNRLLGRHPEVWVSPIKELHFFDALYLQSDGKPQAPTPEHIAAFIENLQERFVRRGFAALKPTADLRECSLEAADLMYGSIFAQAASNMLCGEVTPRYALLPEAAIQHILGLQPRMKFIFIMRDPVERLWSALRMHAAEKEGQRMTADRCYAYMKEIDFARTNYPVTLKSYGKCVPPERFLRLYFDDIISHPVDVIGEVCRFLGINPSKEMFRDSSKIRRRGHNIAMTSEIYDRLRDKLRPIYLQLLFDWREPRFAQWFARHYASP